tara:strand:+ start:18960 stop:19505 length:546 start_codon:yes stop_codon:yes gene_type:complete
MGHSTNYTGKIRITNLDLEKVRQLKKFLGANKHDLVKDGILTEDQASSLRYSYLFDMELDEDMTALQWNGSCETNELETWLILVRGLCELEYQEGDSILCQGEAPEDRYVIIVEGGCVNVRSGAAEACGTEVFVCQGHYYDEYELGGVFASKEDAEDYCTKRNDETDQYSLTWDVSSRTLS